MRTNVYHLFKAASLLLLTVGFRFAMAQTGAVYTTQQAGAWTDANIWSITRAGVPVPPSEKLVPSAADTIVIQHLVTVHSMAAGYVELTKGGNLVVTGNLVMGSLAGEGKLTVAATTFPDGEMSAFMTNSSAEVEITKTGLILPAIQAWPNLTIAAKAVTVSDGPLNVLGNLTLTKDGQLTTAFFSNTVRLMGDLRGASRGLNLTKSAVYIMGEGEQTIHYFGTAAVRKLVVDKEQGNLVVKSKLLVSKQLLLTKGKVVLDDHTLTLAKSAILVQEDPSASIQTLANAQLVYEGLRKDQAVNVPLTMNDEATIATFVLRDKVSESAKIGFSFRNGVPNGMAGSKNAWSNHIAITAHQVSSQTKYDFQFKIEDVLFQTKPALAMLIETNAVSVKGAYDKAMESYSMKGVVGFGEVSVANLPALEEKKRYAPMRIAVDNNENTGLTLNWRQPRFDDSEYFIIEKSVDGQHYMPIDTLTARPWYHMSRQLIWNSQSNMSLGYAYRVTKVDLEGNRILSRSVTPGINTAQGESMTSAIVSLQPGEQFQVFVNNFHQPQLVVSVQDNAGHSYFETMAFAEGNMGTALIPVTFYKKLEPGKYTVRVSDGRETVSSTMVVLPEASITDTGIALAE